MHTVHSKKLSKFEAFLSFSSCTSLDYSFFFSFRFWSTSLLLWPSNGNALEDSHTRLKSFESFALPLVAIGFFLLLFHDMDHYTFNIFSQAYSNGTKLFFPLMAVTPHARGNEYKNWLAHDMTITRKWDHCTYLY